MLKKAGIVFSILIGLVLLIAILVPVLIDVDQYRPEIESIANDSINGEVKIGKLSLSLWGHIAVEIEGVQVKDDSAERLLEVDGAYVYFPFLSLISGKPQLKVELNEPSIYLTKDQEGKINILALAKSDPKAEIEPKTTEPTKSVPTQEPENSGESQASEQQQLPEIVLNAQSTIAINRANVFFKDLGSQDEYNLKDLNVLLEDISLSKVMKIKIWSKLDTKMGDIAVLGPVEIKGKVKSIVEDQVPTAFEIDLKTDFSDMKVSLPGTLEKKPGIDGILKLQGTVSPRDLRLTNLGFKFHELSLSGDGEVQLSPLNYVLSIRQEEVSLKAMEAVLPVIKGIFAEEVRYSWSALVKTDLLESLKIDANSANTDLTIMGKVEGFAKPDIRVSVKSNQLNLDTLLPKSEASEQAPSNKSAKKPAAVSEGSATPAVESPSTPPVDLDKKLDTLRNNEFLKGMVANLLVKMEKVIVSNVTITQLMTSLKFENLALDLEPLKLSVFGGSMNTVASLDLKPQQPSYSLGLDVKGIDFKAAVESQFPSFANTVIGDLTFKANGVGYSLNSDKMIKNLALKGLFSIKEAQFATVDIGKMVNDGAFEGIQSIRSRWPKLPDYKLKKLKDSSAGYKEFRSDFTLKDGRLEAPNFKGEPYPEKGYLIQGYTAIDLVGDKLEANWNVVDLYNKTGLRDVALKERGVEIKELLAEPGKPVRLPIKVGCKLSSPCYKFESIPGHFAKVAGGKIKKALGNRAQQELNKVKKKQQEKIKKEAKKAEEKLKDKAKELLKGKLPF